MSAEETLARLALHRAESARSWRLVVDRQLCLGPPDSKHLSGGACTAAMIAAVEATTGLTLIEASTRFIAAPLAGVDARIHADVIKAGRTITTARAVLAGPGGDAATLSCSLTAPSADVQSVWRTAPEVPPPGDCGRIPFVREDPDDLHSQLDMRIANNPGKDRDGRLVFWVQAPDKFEVQASVFLALVADYLPEAIHFNLGRRAGAVSLDNSIRIASRTPSRWLLCETRLAAISGGLFHGEMAMFSDSGALLALASQSGLVRRLD